MEILILGGTAWLGQTIAATALERGHTVTCLARGEAGAVADGAELVASDRSAPGAYDAVAGRDWDAVFEVSWQPGFVRDAVRAIGPRARHWTYVSSGSVYARNDLAGEGESAELLAPHDGDTADIEVYGAAKEACEQATAEVVGDRLHLSRPGIIGGAGDHTGRSGYWVRRAARDPEAPLLVPDTPAAATQVIDVRDLVAWLLDAAEQGIAGPFNAVSPIVPFAHWVEDSREVGGHMGEVVRVSSEWLVEQEVGPLELPFWLPGDGTAGFFSRSVSAAEAAGLRLRPPRELLESVLAWEQADGLHAERRAGMSAERERELLGRIA
ncbi:Rossmann-fold NAD(P)-binding domain-containing protein [Agromyces mangrovi Wang et al. 2018]|uniref:oxidoreductase n=1 Tax=Agromyces mangrovi TaxID=1858653 RepID=UPI0025723313|nr:oxidoreductase [Agromyces mangrovi]